MERTVRAALILAGIAIGFTAANLIPDQVVTAQTSWQCRSWTFTKADDATPIGAWLGQARSVQLTSSGIDVGWHSRVVACKQ